jgi:hypothetical protein
MYRKINVLILPSKTETDCVIGKFLDTNQLIVRNDNDIPRGVPHHLYFLSDEEIKKGDWIYDIYDGIVKVEHEYQLSNIMVFRKDCKKIIVTTDKTLGLSDVGKAGYSVDEFYPVLPQPSQSFIKHFVEEYNKDNVITEVEVEYEEKPVEELHDMYSIEHERNQRLKANPKDNTINIKENSSYHTPKGKAYELFNKFLPILGNIENKDWVYFHGEEAKQCALILVDEILKNFGTLTEGKQHYAAYCTIKFYQEVKQEIEKI